MDGGGGSVLWGSDGNGFGGVCCGGAHDGFGADGGFAETVDTLLLCALRWVFLIVARSFDGVGFLGTLINDSAVVVAVLLAAVDDALGFECAAEGLKRDLKIDFCHGGIVFVGLLLSYVFRIEAIDWIDAIGLFGLIFYGYLIGIVAVGDGCPTVVAAD